jgi:hypothetical protein
MKYASMPWLAAHGLGLVGYIDYGLTKKKFAYDKQTPPTIRRVDIGVQRGV